MQEYTPVWHVRIKNGIREFHPSYMQLNELTLSNVPDEYWYPDPIHLIKPEYKTHYKVQ